MNRTSTTYRIGTDFRQAYVTYVSRFYKVSNRSDRVLDRNIWIQAGRAINIYVVTPRRVLNCSAIYPKLWNFMAR